LSPEFRNRIDEIELFTPLTVDDVSSIARGHFSELEETLERAGRAIDIDDDAVELISIVKRPPSLAC
jgi:ATP-dependent Clp protease ATP-binding subunit ClpB